MNNKLHVITGPPFKIPWHLTYVVQNNTQRTRGQIIILIYLLSISGKPGAPDAPVISNIKATSVDLKWSPPKSDGGAPIQSYTVEYKATTQHRWIKSTDDTTETTHRVVDIVEGYDYEFRIAATNKAGTGPFSEPSKSVLVKEKISKYTLVGLTSSKCSWHPWSRFALNPWN